jgi:exodeoxyribonuclease V alpha subunit
VPVTLTGNVARITFENDTTSFRVIKLGDLEGESSILGVIAVVGTFPAVGTGARVRVTGDFTVDAKHGKQFRAESVVTLTPDTLSGLEKYLGSGVIPGIGPGFAKRIVEIFGMQSLSVLDTNPERLAEVPGLGARRVEDIRKGWKKHHALSNVMMLLQSHGASPALAGRIVQRYGDQAATIVQQHPYRLALDVRGVGFKTADRIASSLGLREDHPERVQAGIMHELGQISDQGHVFAPRPVLEERAAQMLQVGEDHVRSGLEQLWASGRLVVEDDRVSTARLANAERNLAKSLARLLKHPARQISGLDKILADYESKAGLTLAPRQREAVRLVAENSVVVITGGPGVGKTTIVRAIVNTLREARIHTYLAAPTGRAAKRLTEATKHPATTLHRLLEFEPRSGKFQRNAESPLTPGAVIVDETSMVDLPLAEALLEAIPTGARLVFVGDSDQLPSVGPGAVLRDVIDCNLVPTVRLNEIFRQVAQSRIVQNAHRILVGEEPETSAADDPAADFFVSARKDAEQAAELVLRLATERIPERFGLDPKTDVQVLSPMHRGPAGTLALNLALQRALNGSGPSIEVHGQAFRSGDKVMQTRNDYDREVFNGDIGLVANVDPESRTLTVRFDDREVAYEDSDLDSLTLAYATSIHKSQGSEYPAVVVPLLTSHFVMLSRNLLYTAVTRARKLCVLVADPRALSMALSEARREERLTRLVERLREAAH